MSLSISLWKHKPTAGCGLTHTLGAQLCSRWREQHVQKSWGRREQGGISRAERNQYIWKRERGDGAKRERAGGRERETECVCVCVCVVQNEAREGGARAHSLVATLRSFVSDLGLPRWHSDKEPPCQCRRHKRCGFSPWVGKIPWSRAWQHTPVFLPGESHGQRSLVGYS